MCIPVNVVVYSLADGNDYNSVGTFLLTFDSATTSIDVPVTIIDDTVFELTESFIVTLSFPGAPVPGVTLDPDSAQTTILDDDGWYIFLIVPLCSLYIYTCSIHMRHINTSYLIVMHNVYSNYYRFSKYQLYCE